MNTFSIDLCKVSHSKQTSILQLIGYIFFNDLKIMSIGNALKMTSYDDFPAFDHFSKIRTGVSRQAMKNAGHKDNREDGEEIFRQNDCARNFK